MTSRFFIERFHVKTTELLGAKVLLPKKPVTKGKHVGEERFSKLGKIHNVVFAPFKQGQSSQVVGVMVQKPDIAGMIKQDDAFVTLESLETIEQGLCVKDPENNVDKAAIKRLNLDFDTCILWHGMEARTKSGKSLGYVSGAEFDQVTGVVSAFLVGDGAGSEALVGSFAIKPEWLLGYSNGAMVLSDEAADAQLTGGLAAKAGEGYAAAAAKASEATAKAGKAVAEATEKGAFAWVRRWPRQSVRSKTLPSPTQKTIPSDQLPLLQRMFASRSHLRRSRSRLIRAQLVSLPLSPRANHLHSPLQTRPLRVLACSLDAWARCSLTSRTNLTRQASNKSQINA